jgi:hypothetical protein
MSSEGAQKGIIVRWKFRYKPREFVDPGRRLDEVLKVSTSSYMRNLTHNREESMVEVPRKQTRGQLAQE